MSPTPKPETAVVPKPVRVLCIVANPSDLAAFDAGRAWKDVHDGLRPLLQDGRVTLEPAQSLTEDALRHTIGRDRFEVIYFIGHAHARAANYGTLALVTVTQTARHLTAPSVANLFCERTGVRLVILQAISDADFQFDAMARAIAERGAAVALAPALDMHSQQSFLRTLFAGFVDNLPGDILRRDLSAIASLRGSRVRFIDGAAGIALETGGEPFRGAAEIPVLPRPPLTIPPQTTAPLDKPPAWRDKLSSKRARGQFDVFLCYHSADQPSVMRIGQRLKEAGILPWLDCWELQPGQPWQRELDRQIGNIRAAAVFVGPGGLGPWQEQEIDAFLREFVARNAPVIPTLLPDAPAAPVLPVFLRAMTWVDFRLNDPDPLTRLLWGVTGERPQD